MRNIITLTALALGLSTGGVAMADRSHGGGHGSHGGGNVVVRDHRSGGVVVHENHGGGSWGRHDSGRVVVREHNNWHRGGDWHGGTYYRSGWRRPIYVNRPIIRERYYNYYQRPAVVVENYNSMEGYYWVAGQWQWTGYEWSWQPGHYEADPNYYVE